MSALPTDEESRTFHHLYTSYAVRSVTDLSLAAQPFIQRPDASVLVGQRGQDSAVAVLAHHLNRVFRAPGRS